MVKTSDCGSDMRGFESHYPPHKKDFGFCRSLFYLIVGMRTPKCASIFIGFEREVAEAAALLPSDIITKAKRGIAV